MKKKKRLSLDWALLASAGISFLFGKYIAAEYERQFLESGLYEEVYPISTIALGISGFLIFCLIILWVVRFIRRK